MKNGFSFLIGIGVSATLLITAQGCSRDQVRGGSATDSTVTTSTSTTIAVATDSVGTDSVYILQDCGRGNYRDSIAAGALPSVTAAYLDSAYKGYSLISAFEVKDKAGTVENYVAVIRFNGIPVGLLFNADGTFLRVLEQREPGDIDGRGGYHHGGRYGNRDGGQRDTVALTSLPPGVAAYFNSHYPADTLEKAYRNIDSSLLVISKDSVWYATTFSADGNFISRTEIHVRRYTSFTNLGTASLPATITTYLTNTYPNYVPEKAVSYSIDGNLAGYLVFIDANNSKYAVEFDASGNFTGAITLF